MTRRGLMKRNATAVCLAAALPLALGACGSSGGGSSSSGGADTIKVVDYYNNEPDKTVFQEVLDSCGADLGVSVERQTIPGGDLIATPRRELNTSFASGHATGSTRPPARPR